MGTIIFLLINELWIDFSQTNIQVNYFALIIATVFLFLGHELGHATAMKKYNLSTKGIGIGFYFFTPVLYADVSDAWKLPSRQRVIVDLGGFHFQAIITILYFICAILLQSHTLLNIVFLSLATSLFNFNPFIKSDFYWGISDYFEIQHLQEKANNEFFKLFKCSNINLPLTLYGLLRYAFIIFIIYIILTMFYSSANKILLGNYEITFWSIERDILILISMFFFIYEAKKTISNFCSAKVKS